MPPAPPATRTRADSCSFQDRDPAGQPVDIDVVLALARSQRYAPAIGATVGEKADGPDFIAQEVALGSVELEVDLPGQAMRVLVRRHSKRARLEVELEQRFGALRYGAVPCQAQPGCDVACRALEVGTGDPIAKHRQHHRRDQRHQREHDQQLEHRDATTPATHRSQRPHSQLAMSWFVPPPPSLPSAPWSYTP